MFQPQVLKQKIIFWILWNIFIYLFSKAICSIDYFRIDFYSHFFHLTFQIVNIAFGAD